MLIAGRLSYPEKPVADGGRLDLAAQQADGLQETDQPCVRRQHRRAVVRRGGPAEDDE